MQSVEEKKNEPSPIKRLGSLILLFMVIGFLSFMANLALAAFLPESNPFHTVAKVVAYLCLGLGMLMAIKLSLQIMTPIVKHGKENRTEILPAFSDFMKKIAKSLSDRSNSNNK